MEDELRASVRGIGSTVAIDLEGALTATGEAVLETARSDPSARAARSLILNFAGVDYVNSAGVAVLIRLMSRVRETDQRLVLVGLRPHYRKIFHMMGLSQFAPVFESELDALEALQDA